MSASVFKPIRPHDMARIRTPPPLERRLGVSKDVQKVRRMLFGPVDHEESRRMAEEHLARQMANGMSRWEFDFKNGVPLNPSTRYIWSIVTPPQETCKRPTKKSQIETVEEENLHLYLDPLEDLINPPNNKPLSLSSDEESEETEKMLVSPIRSTPCKKLQTAITDYMTVKKSGIISTVKRPTEQQSVSRPSKLPRTSQSSAS